VPHAVLAVEDALHNRRNSPMSLRCWGGVGSIAVRGCDVSKQVPRILLADDLKLGQGNEESLANAKGRHAIGFIETGMFWGRYPFDSNLTRQGNIRPDPY